MYDSTELLELPLLTGMCVSCFFWECGLSVKSYLNRDVNSIWIAPYINVLHPYKCLQSALQFHPMRIISVVLICDTWEICLVFCKQIPDRKFLKLSLLYKRELNWACVYKIRSKSPMYRKPKQPRQYASDGTVAPTVYNTHSLFWEIYINWPFREFGSDVLFPWSWTQLFYKVVLTTIEIMGIYRWI